MNEIGISIIKFTPWSGIHLEKLIIAQLVKKLLVLHRTQRFVTIYTRS
jgi:hypothetical protein